MMRGLATIEISTIAHWAVIGGYFTALAIAATYGLHRYWLVIRYFRTRRVRLRRFRARHLRRRERFAALPKVTVQLPMFNESSVAERVIQAACRIEYPRELLQIQVLDDSTDECAKVTHACVERMAQEGHQIQWLHRANRMGYKAGALQAGLAAATGEFIAVFDADFLPPRQFLRRTIHRFSDPNVAMVQGAWDHLNRGDCLLTQCQAVYLDSHFQIEHPARYWDGCWFNFNGTAGIWRRKAIETSGGWQHDTLTEDMDLSYRAQLAGWKFIFLQGLRCPAELPPEINAFKTQQHRWTKGTVQTARKLLGGILRSAATRRQKREAFFHLTSPVVYPCVLIIALLMYPAVAMDLSPFERGTFPATLFGLMILLLATASGSAFYTAGQFVRRRPLWNTIARQPALVAIGVGMSMINSIAVIEAILGRQSPFVRTPKFNAQREDSAVRQAGASGVRVHLPRRWGVIALECTFGLYLSICTALSLQTASTLWAMPFLVLFACGYLYVGLTSIMPPSLSPIGRPVSDRCSEAPLPAVANG